MFPIPWGLLQGPLEVDGGSRHLVDPLSLCPVQLKLQSTYKVKSRSMTGHTALKSQHQGSLDVDKC